jgi:hypothetical protein
MTEAEFVKVVRDAITGGIKDPPEEVDRAKVISSVEFLSLNPIQGNALLCVLERGNVYFPPVVQLLWEILYFYEKIKLLQS